MTLGRVRQLPTSRGQAGYRAQAMLAFPRARADEVGTPLVLLGRAGKYSASLQFASGTTAVTALVIADAARRGISGCCPGAARISSHISPAGAGQG